MTTPQASEAKEDVNAPSRDILKLQRNSRAFTVGTTGTGKSTLMEVLMSEYIRAYSTAKKLVRVLIVDTKPRWRAEREVNGLSTELSGRYAKWEYGSGVIPNSYTLHQRASIKEQLDQIWSYKSSIAIAQTEREEEWEWASEVAVKFYERYGAGIPRLIIADELADFFKRPKLSDIFQRVARNGRERGVGLIAGSQRPRKIPVEILTEMTRLYMFELDNKDDIDRVQEMGIPELVYKPSGFQFFLWDKKLKLEYPSNSYFQLDLTNNFWK